MPDAADLIREAAEHFERAATILRETAAREGTVVADTDKLTIVQKARDVGEKADAVLRRAGRALAGLGF